MTSLGEKVKNRAILETLVRKARQKVSCFSLVISAGWWEQRTKPVPPSKLPKKAIQPAAQLPSSPISWKAGEVPKEGTAPHF